MPSRVRTDGLARSSQAVDPPRITAMPKASSASRMIWPGCVDELAGDVAVPLVAERASSLSRSRSRSCWARSRWGAPSYSGSRAVSESRRSARATIEPLSSRTRYCGSTRRPAAPWISRSRVSQGDSLRPSARASARRRTGSPRCGFGSRTRRQPGRRDLFARALSMRDDEVDDGEVLSELAEDEFGRQHRYAADRCGESLAGPRPEHVQRGRSGRSCRVGGSQDRQPARAAEAPRARRACAAVRWQKADPGGSTGRIAARRSSETARCRHVDGGRSVTRSQPGPRSWLGADCRERRRHGCG